MCTVDKNAALWKKIFNIIIVILCVGSAADKNCVFWIMLSTCGPVLQTNVLCCRKYSMHN